MYCSEGGWTDVGTLGVSGELWVLGSKEVIRLQLLCTLRRVLVTWNLWRRFYRAAFFKEFHDSLPYRLGRLAA